MRNYKFDKDLSNYDKNALKEIFQVRLTGTNIILKVFDSLEEAQNYTQILSKDVLLSLESFINHTYTFHRVSNILKHKLK